MKEWTLRTGPFVTRIRMALPLVEEGLVAMYPGEWLGKSELFSDFHVAVDKPAGLRRWLRPQAMFWLDGVSPFKPLPVEQAYAMFEWGLNWCISNHLHAYLMLHAAVLEREGRALVMPAPPGSGKSTLAAGLMLSGWRLLSDELAIIDCRTNELIPLARPVSLKNASIDVIRSFSSDAVIGRIVSDTAKGTVTHLRATDESHRRVGERARPGWIVFPKYVAGAKPRLIPAEKGQSYMTVAEGSFNYGLLGEAGYHALTALVDASDCYQFEYSKMEDAVNTFEQLAASRRV
ncbi:MAG: HprK-related kinase A [Thiobacillaceae bacterium]